jgi:TolB protein
MFKTILLTCGLATSLFAQGTNFGIFEGATDVGEVAKKGSVDFDSAKGEYRMTGSGANIWAKHDDFFFLWRKLSGDIILTATVRFEGDGGAPHRKAVLMIRKELEPDSPQVNATLHASGLVALESREAADDISRSVRFPVNAPTRIRLERHGNWYTLSAAKEGQPLAEAGSIQVILAEPVYAGLALCPHDAKAEMTAVFSDVTLENPAAAGTRKEKKKEP